MSIEKDIDIRGLLPAVFFISFAAIGWQLGLMRALLISRYHHFSFLVISCALLGFGAGGTLLSIADTWFERQWDRVFRWGLLCFAISIPASFRLGELLPLNVYFPPAVLVSTLAWWFLFWIVHLVPFFLAGVLIGLALMISKEKVHTIYGGNLAGSAAGALGAIVLMNYFPANGLAVPFSLAVLLPGLVMIPSRRGVSRWGYGIALLITGSVLVATEIVGADRIFPLRIDQYKALAYAQRLVEQGSARRVRSLYGPRGRIDLYSGPYFHTVLSMSSKEPPPQMDMLLRDGFPAGAVLRIDSIREARFLDGTLAALPYRLLHPERVLILGDNGGIHVWLARLSSARSIVLVEPDSNVVRILRNHPSRVLDDPRVHVVVAEPRAFLDTTKMTFDIIHLTALEGFAPGSGGIGGLREDYLATVEGFGRCLDALTSGGLACVVRGIQEPARDNIKIAATWIEALERRKVRDPGDYLLMARDELSLATLAGRSPIEPDLIQGFIRAVYKMSWDLEWYPGIKPANTNRVHVLPGPPGQKVSWYHYAMAKLLSGQREDFYKNWICNVRPARDDQPFFLDFFRWASITKLRVAFGALWPARAEMGFLVLILAAVWTAFVASVLLPAPLILFRARGRRLAPGGTIAILLYFGGLGMAFMFLEMSFIQIFTGFLGDPILAAALVLCGFLLFAGIGSLNQPALTGRVPGGIFTVGLIIAAMVIAYSMAVPLVFRELAMVNDMWKTLVSLSLMAPLALLMGNPFPWGLAVLHRRAPHGVPIAWTVNGFASVVAASIAVMCAMAFGFKTLLGLAALLYVLAGVISFPLSKTRFASRAQL